VDGFNARNLEGFLRCYSSDAVLTDGTGNIMMQGRDAIRGFYAKLFADSPNLHVEIPSRVHVGSWVIDEEHVTGFNFEGFPPEMHAAVIYHVQNGEIVRAMLLM